MADSPRRGRTGPFQGPRSPPCTAVLVRTRPTRGFSGLLGRHRPAPLVVGEPEVHHPHQVHRGGTVREPHRVADASAVGEAPAVLAHEPREAAFDHRPVVAISLEKGVGPCRHARRDQQVVVGVELDDPTTGGLRAEVAHRTARAVRTEACGAAPPDRHGDAFGAGDRGRVAVDDEVVDVVAAGDCRAKWSGLDDRGHLLLLEVRSQLTGAIGRIAEDLGACRLVLEQARRGFGVAEVRLTEMGGGDEAGVRFDRHVGFVAIAIAVGRLVHVAGLRVDDRDDAIRCRAPRDLPVTGAVGRLDVLACDECEQCDRVGLCLVEVELLSCEDELVGVFHEHRDEPVDVGPVLVVSRWLAAGQVLLVDEDAMQLGDELSDAPHLGDDHRDRVLALDRVVKHGRVERSAVLSRDHAGEANDVAHRVEDALRTVRDAELRAPQREHRWMEGLVGEAEATRCLPRDVRLQRPAGLTIAQSLEGLQHHYRRDDVRRHRGTAATGREQIREHLVGEQSRSVLGEERVHRALAEKVATEHRSIEKSLVVSRRSLHEPSLIDRRRDRESTISRADCSAVS